MWKKKSAGSKYLRDIVSKLNAVDDSVDADYWGPAYEGGDCAPLTAAEEKVRDQILNQSMSSYRYRKRMKGAKKISQSNYVMFELFMIQCLPNGSHNMFGFITQGKKAMIYF